MQKGTKPSPAAFLHSNQNPPKAKAQSQTSSPSERQAQANALANANGTFGNNAKLGITGVKLGSPVRSGAQISPGPWSTGLGVKPVYSSTQYGADAMYTIPNTLSNNDKAQLLYGLAQVKGLYAKGMAPTVARLQAMGTSVVFTDADYTAFTKILKNADNTGQDYTSALNSWIKNPSLATSSLQAVVPKSPKLVPFTPPGEASANLTSRFMDLFNQAPDSKTIAGYTKDIHSLEVARKNNASAYPQEAENIFLKYAQQAATTRTALAAKTKTPSATGTGQLSDVVRQLKNAYNDNGIPMSDSQIYTKAVAALRSPQALQNELNVVVSQAGMHWPGFKELIDKGQTVQNLLGPYMAVRNQITGVPLSQMKPSDFYSVAADPKALVSPAAYGKTLYSTPEYKSSNNYMNQTMSDLQYTMKAFGIG